MFAKLELSDGEYWIKDVGTHLEIYKTDESGCWFLHVLQIKSDTPPIGAVLRKAGW